MRHSRFRHLLCAGIVSLGGCASMTPQQCLHNDWYQAGFSSAAAGRSVADYAAYNSGCNLHGIHINRNAFLRGWVAGRSYYLEKIDSA